MPTNTQANNAAAFTPSNTQTAKEAIALIANPKLAKPKLAREHITLLVSEVNNDSGVEMAALDLTYIVATFTWEDLTKMKAATSIANFMSKWASISLPTKETQGFKEPEAGLDLNYLAACLDTLNENEDDLHVRTDSISANISMGNLRLSGTEQYGFPFSSNSINIQELERAFITGKMKSYEGWHLLPLTE